ncbi:MAG: NAD-dependent epimerase/dehydratase family protein [Burkholderiaceae bacterium]|nr:MAG: NAD-dependent epimerase/dehydratase family protein [Burkholderiaceae bacterium]
MKVLILGATGLVGQELLKQALANPEITSVIAPTRSALKAHPKLFNPLIQFDRLPADEAWWQADVMLCALGSTIKQAGSQTKFFEIDHGIVLSAAAIAKSAGTSRFIYNSSLGAYSQSSNFYLRTKGQIEHDLEVLGFEHLGIVRPSFLKGPQRKERRVGEEIALVLAGLFEPLIPMRYRAVSTSRVAAAMWQLALEQTPRSRVEIIESDTIYKLVEPIQ